VGHRHAHLLGAEGKLAAALRPGAPVVAEGGRYMVQLKQEQAAAFADKVAELAAGGGLERRAEALPGVDGAHLVFVARGAAAGCGE
jgi:hypothetical protein